MRKARAFFWILLAALWAPGGVVAADRITQADIERMLGEVDAAAQRKDLSTIGRHFSPAVVIEIEMPGPNGQRPIMRMTKDEYLRSTQEAWSQTTDYSYTRRDTSIRIAPNGKSAEVSAIVVETMRIQGQPVVGRTRETTRVELIGGRPLVTHVRGNVIHLGPRDSSGI